MMEGYSLFLFIHSSPATYAECVISMVSTFTENATLCIYHISTSFQLRLFTPPKAVNAGRWHRDLVRSLQKTGMSIVGCADDASNQTLMPSVGLVTGTAFTGIHADGRH